MSAKRSKSRSAKQPASGSARHAANRASGSAGSRDGGTAQPTSTEASPLVLTWFLTGLVANFVSVTAGSLAVHTYIVTMTEILGLSMQHLRPIHTTGALSWLHLAGIAVAYHALDERGRMTKSSRIRGWLHLGSWILAGIAYGYVIHTPVREGATRPPGLSVVSFLMLVGSSFFIWNVSQIWKGKERTPEPAAFLWLGSGILMAGAYAGDLGHRLTDPTQLSLISLRAPWLIERILRGSADLLALGCLLHFVGRLLPCGATHPRWIAKALSILTFLGIVFAIGGGLVRPSSLPEPEWLDPLLDFLTIMLTGIFVNMWVERLEDPEKHGRNLDAEKVVLRWIRRACALVCMLDLILAIPGMGILRSTLLQTAHTMGRLIGIHTLALFGYLIMILGETSGVPATTGRGKGSIRMMHGLAACTLAMSICLACRGLEMAYLQEYGLLAVSPPWILRHFPAAFLTFGGTAGGILMIFDLRLGYLITRSLIAESEN